MIRKETLENWYNQLSGIGSENIALQQIRFEMEKELKSSIFASPPLIPTQLVEGKDFDWEVEKGIFISNRTPKLNDGTVLNKIWSPKIHEVVFVENNGGNEQAILVPAIILEGQYEVNGRIKNFWTWQYINDDLTLGDTVSDHGNFYDFHAEYNIKAELSLKVFS
jgi:hypothetical protein